ncbi:hypothetical protein Acsp03_14040 [Actinomadura sp. NBRC 104412]|uniref:hypothetical protein n=1 Tax=Actinomadura sp. NBRC 104412 TaxID=3032203 RepID=UPI0024A1446F|nr:hypothetical protein [Actinomadura sp. NBRC 104412]GLZ03938.1 hypothetical protein Acsp03_14040 [Actinomadura sp. NBRC 104412]
MSNGARHGIGVLVGLVVTPVVAFCLLYGVGRMTDFFRVPALEGRWPDRLIALAVLVVAAVLLGLVMGSRLSPVASLVPGVVFTAFGLLWLLMPEFAGERTGNMLPRSLDFGYGVVAPYGILLLLGVALLVASMSPSRWRVAGASPARSRYGMPPAPMGPGGAAPPPQYGAPPVPAGQYRPAPSPHAPGPAVPPPYSPPGASGPPQPPSDVRSPQPPPAPEPAPEPPRQGGGEQRQEAGEWTQMYGGDDLRRGQGGSGG